MRAQTRTALFEQALLFVGIRVVIAVRGRACWPCRATLAPASSASSRGVQRRTVVERVQARFEHQLS